MSLNNFDLDLAIVAMLNVAIVALSLAAACFLFYIGHPIAGGWCIALPFFACMSYNGSHKSK